MWDSAQVVNEQNIGSIDYKGNPTVFFNFILCEILCKSFYIMQIWFLVMRIFMLAHHSLPNISRQPEMVAEFKSAILSFDISK